VLNEALFARQDMPQALISIVVPTHNERDNVSLLYARISAVFAALPSYDFELIFADDSGDDTPGIVQGLHEKDSRVKLVRLSRRFSQSVAITAAMSKASGDAVVMMDADLQDPPEVIPRMLELWRQGYQAVYAERPSSSDYFLYRFFARAFYILVASVSSVEIPGNAGEFRLLDGGVLKFLNSLTEHTRFMRGLTLWPVQRRIAIPIERAPRQSGKTNYNFWRSLLVAVDGVASFSIVPLRVAAFLGFGLALISLFIGFALVVMALVLRLPFGSGWPSLFVSIWFLSGVQLFSVGILGEYLGRVYVEVQNRPLYWVDYEVGFEKPVAAATLRD
jgi:polyisoprenyl-phosphate glycosyltransferase